MGCIYPVERRESYVTLQIISFLRLAKLPLCLMIALSAMFGFIMASHSYSLQLLYATLGVLLLASGGATWNSLQEIHFDARMERTRGRPLVKKELSPFKAKVQTFILLIAGILLLKASTNSYWPTLVGGSGIILYNLVYTQLKSKTSLAIIPGAICGALPPYIGWLAGGGGVLSYKAFMLFCLLILWQVPHFFLVLLNYKKDYLDGVIPNILMIVKENSLRRIFITWIGALSAMMLIFTVMLNELSLVGRILISGNALVLFTFFAMQMVVIKRPNYRFLFMHLNFSIFFIMFVVCAGAV